MVSARLGAPAKTKGLALSRPSDRDATTMETHSHVRSLPSDGSRKLAIPASKTVDSANQCPGMVDAAVELNDLIIEWHTDNRLGRITFFFDTRMFS